MHFDAEFWVFIAFLAFIGVIIYYKLPAMITGQLDARGDRIRRQLEEARSLREEAQALLAQFQRKQRDVIKEAEDIIAQANREAEQLTQEARAALEEMIERRRMLAQQKIAQAQAQAIADIRNLTIELGTEAARSLIRGAIDQSRANQLVDDAIVDLDKHLH